MQELSGYINQNAIVVNGNISSFDGYNVIVTILDSTRDKHAQSQDDTELKKAAARELAGLWKSHEDSSVEEMVRGMRRGRSFDY